MSKLYDLLQRQGYLSPPEAEAEAEAQLPPPRRPAPRPHEVRPQDDYPPPPRTGRTRHDTRPEPAEVPYRSPQRPAPAARTQDRPAAREQRTRWAVAPQPLPPAAPGPGCPPMGELEALFNTTIPRSWIKDIQRIAFFVTSQIDDEQGRLNLVFSGLNRRVGTTTISMMIAHYLAAEMSHKQVLYLQYAPSVVPSAASCRTIQVGQPDFHQFFQGEVPIFNWVGILPDANISPPVASRWFRGFIEAAKQQYAIIIADTPPFGDEPGSYALARIMDGVVLVLASGESRYPAVNALVDELDDLGIQIVGAVLNRRRYAIPRWLLRLI